MPKLGVVTADAQSQGEASRFAPRDFRRNDLWRAVWCCLLSFYLDRDVLCVYPRPWTIPVECRLISSHRMSHTFVLPPLHRQLVPLHHWLLNLLRVRGDFKMVSRTAQTSYGCDFKVERHSFVVLCSSDDEKKFNVHGVLLSVVLT